MTAEIWLAVLLGFAGGFIFAVLFIITLFKRMVKMSCYIKNGDE